MKKSDLKNGMVVTLKYGNECVIAGSFLINNNLTVYNDLINYNEDLTNKYNGQYNIVRVQKENKFETLWERKVIDWNKVPVGAKVRVWDEYDTYIEGEGLFLEYIENDRKYPFRAYVKDNDFNYWSNCELIEEPNSDSTYEELDSRMKAYCEEAKRDECKNIGCGPCTVKFILSNYNVTRKDNK